MRNASRPGLSHEPNARRFPYHEDSIMCSTHLGLLNLLWTGPAALRTGIAFPAPLIARVYIVML
jgi:hypothetical protein